MGRWHYGYVIVACCCLIMGVNVGLVLSCAGIFYQPVSEGLGVSVGQFGLYMSVSYVASTLMLTVAGRLMERYSARWLLAASSALLGMALLMMSRMTQVWHAYAAGGVIGIGMAFQMYLSFPTLINRWFSHRVGLYMGICSAASGVGGMLFNPLCAHLILNYGWQTAYAVLGGIIVLIVSPLLTLLLRDKPSDMGLQPCGASKASQKTDATTDGTDFATAVRQPVFYALFAFALLIMAVSTLNLFIPKYVAGLSYTLPQAALAASMVMAGVTLGKIALGYINDQSGIAGVLTTTIGGIGGLGLMLAGHASFVLVLVGAFLFGWAYAGVTVQTPMLVRRVFGSRDYVRIYSIISIAISVGGAISSGAWGYVADATSYATILIVGITFLATCALIGVAALRRSER